MRNLIDNNPTLLRLIARYHGQPSRLVHEDRWPTEVQAPVRELLQASAAGERRLRNWMHSTWELDSTFCYDFAESRHRIALLRANELQSLKLYCGAAIHSAKITRAIDRTTQTQFRELLGEKAYNFALKRASFLVGKLPDELKPHTTTPDQILGSGQLCLAACVHDAPDELHRRLEFAGPGSGGFQHAPVAGVARLQTENQKPIRTLASPATANPATSVPAMDQWRLEATTTEHTPAIWAFVKRILLTEIVPELKPCFA